MRRLTAGAGKAGIALIEQVLQVGFVLARLLQSGGETRESRLRVGLGRAFERQQRGQFVDLPVQALQRDVLAGDVARQKKLRHHEHGNQKREHEKHRRQRVDETRPIIDRAKAASTRERHRSAPLVFRREPFEQAFDVALLRRLRLDPIADQLLLAAHMLHEALYAFGEIGDRDAGRAGA